MAEIDSRQKDKIDAGTKLLPSEGNARVYCAIFQTPAAAAWAQNDVLASGIRIPPGARILPISYSVNSAFGSSVTADVGLRDWITKAEVDLDGIADGIDIAAAGADLLNTGVLVASGATSATAVATEPVVTFLSANPTDDAQMTVYIFYTLH